MMLKLFGLLCFLLILQSSSAQPAQTALQNFLNDSAVKTGHAGVAIYNVTDSNFLIEYNAGKNFLPSSTAKLFTLYAGLKYSGDSIVGLRWYKDSSGATHVFPSADPTFLNSHFKTQPVFDFLKAQDSLVFHATDSIVHYAPGWSWEDYKEEYMVPRTAFPVYGNYTGTPLAALNYISLLRDTLRKNIGYSSLTSAPAAQQLTVLYSQKADAVFKRMMHESDNFIAEQTLLMSSRVRYGMFVDSFADSLLKYDFPDIPQSPRWVDGSGLSRYNLFSPLDFIYILTKLRKEFGAERIQLILPQAGAGTLTNYYETIGKSISAKTGSMSNSNALSGYLVTKKNKLLYFSVMVNNFVGPGRAVRRATERFLTAIYNSN